MRTDKSAASRTFLRPEVIVTLVILVVCIPYAILFPVGCGLDEAEHVARVYQLAQGQLKGDVVGYAEGYPTDTEEEKANAALWGGEVDSTLIEVTLANKAAFAATADDGSPYEFSFPAWLDHDDDEATLELGDNGTQTYVFSNTVVNAPTVYLPQLLGYLISSTFIKGAYVLVVAMRLFGIMAYAACVYVAVRTIPVGKWALAVVAALPNTLATVSCVSADTVTNALCFLAIAFLLRFALADELPGISCTVGLCLTVTLLTTAKMTYVPLAFGPLLLFAVNPVCRTRRFAIPLVAATLVGVGIYAAWAPNALGINTCAMFDIGYVSTAEQLAYVKGAPLTFVRRFLGNLMHRNVFQLGPYIDAYTKARLSGITRWGIAGLLLLSVVGSVSWARRPRLAARRSLVVCALLVLAFFICAFLVYLATYLTFNQVGANTFDGIPKRYFVPIIGLLLVAASVAVEVAATSLAARGADEDDDVTPLGEGASLAVQNVASILCTLGIVAVEAQFLLLAFTAVY